jgi:hypothetical protein
MKLTWSSIQSITKPDHTPKLLHITRTLALAALVAAVLTNVYELKQLVGVLASQQEDGIERYTDRLEQLRTLLPRTGRVGYVGDVPADAISTNPDALKTYGLTQYALVPLVVRPGTGYPFIIGNFSNPVAAARARKELMVVRDFGNGLMLLQKQID